MEEAPLANKPDLAPWIRDHVSDFPNESAIAVILVMSKVPRCWVKPVETSVSRAKPQIPTIVTGDSVDRITANGI
jgi:hypothetical protein